MEASREQEGFQEYINQLKRLHCDDADNMSNEEFLELYEEYLEFTTMRAKMDKQDLKRCKIFSVIIGLSLTILVFSAAYYNAIYSFLSSQLQDYIYPGLRGLRKLFIPILYFFPWLTGLHHETCLVQNPSFVVADMDCWPCSSVNHVREFNNHEAVENQQNAPYIYKTEQEPITPDMLKSFYTKNKDLFTKEAPKILTDNKFYSYPAAMFFNLKSGVKKSYIWAFNNMNVAKTLRQMIPKPEVIPKFGQSTERYLVIDNSQEKFRIPDTDCNYSFILSLSGSRKIVLNPAEECKLQCRPLEVELKQTYLLWYNWWYWRPTVQPSTGNDTFISYVGSYC